LLIDFILLHAVFKLNHVFDQMNELGLWLWYEDFMVLWLWWYICDTWNHC